MKNMKECRFCNILKGVYQYDVIDKPLLETTDFSMICSIGAFLPGWSLIVPREHDFSMKKHYKTKEFMTFFEQVKKLVEKTYDSKIIAFEHGANKSNSQTSCGTCHSHLHILPFNDSLVKELVSEREWITCNFDEIENVVGEKEYLLYCDVLDNIKESTCYIHILEEEISQYFRKVLAKHIDYTEDYSYKTNLLLENTKEIAEAYRKEL